MRFVRPDLFRRFFCLLGFVILCFPRLAFAEVPYVPPGAQPSLLDRRFDLPLTPKSASGAVISPGSESAEAPPGAENITFMLKRIEFEGVTAFRIDDFLPLYKEYLNKTISVKTLYDIAQDITVKYTSSGYILCQAVIPPQEIGEAGIAHIKIVEGYISGVIIKGSPGGTYSALEQISEKVRDSRPLNLAVMERYLLLASDIPGVKINSTLVPSDTALGTSDLMIEVSQNEYEIASSMDNRSGGYYGPWEMSTSIRINSSFDASDRTTLQYANVPFDSNAMRLAKITHDEFFASGSVRVTVNAGYGITHPGGSIYFMSLEGKSETLGTNVTYQVIRSRAENLSVTLGIGASNTSTYEPWGDHLVISSSRSRSFSATVTYDFGDNWLDIDSNTVLSAGTSKGIYGLGASPLNSATLSPANGHPDANKLSVSAERSMHLTEDIGAKLNVIGQLTGVSVLAGDLFTYGGTSIGEGFDPAAITGDQGFAGRCELTYRGPDITFFDAWQAFAFIDYGRGWYLNPVHGGLSVESGSSVGFGARVLLGRYVSMNGNVAEPISYRTPPHLEHPHGMRAFFGLTVSY